MPRVGPYQIPFPYEPYPLQEHAMTALRDFLEGDHDDAPHHHRKTSPQRQAEHPTSDPDTIPPSPAPSAARTTASIAVLESPTGTGKSQMLLNSVLSYLFEPLTPEACREGGNNSQDKAEVTSVEEVAKQEHPQKEEKAEVSSSPVTLEERLKQRQWEEEMERIQLERKARVRAQRKELRQARKLMQLQQQQQQQQARAQSGDAGAEDYLITQDVLQWYKEQQASDMSSHMPTSCNGVRGESGVDALSGYARRPVRSFSSSSSLSLSSSSISSAKRRDDNHRGSSSSEDEDEDAEAAIEGDLATLVPLRKPTVYVASRTHTQLQQLMDDLQKTAFAMYPLRSRIRSSSSSTSSTKPFSDSTSTKTRPSQQAGGVSFNEEDEEKRICGDARGRRHNEFSSPRRLAAVHVAGRQHLCLNARVLRKAASSGNSGDLLNHYCREAMQFERSKPGRQARREQQQQRARQSGLSSTSSKTNTASTLPHSPGHLRDMEDFGGATFLTVEKEKGKAGTPSATLLSSESEGEDRGCAYCAESHLRALLDFLKDEHAAQHRADQFIHARTTASERAAQVHAGSADNSPSVSASIYTMERLRHLGEALTACPYIATRLLLRGADVAFIPYSYLLDEGQRAVLLGGVTTNPATAAEAAAAGIDDPTIHSHDLEHTSSSALSSAHDGDVEMGIDESQRSCVASPTHVTPSLGSVLYHRRQRVTAVAALQQRRRRLQHNDNHTLTAPRNATSASSGQGTAGRDTSNKDENSCTRQRNRNDEGAEEDDMWLVMARSAPPSFRGDIIVFDEAHNIADHCRAISTVSLTPWQLQLSRVLFQAYLDRYEGRLLTRNKQRLRELIRFVGKLGEFCERSAATASSSSASSLTLSSLPSAQVFPFHTFLFEAGVDNVDVYSLLTFLVDSQLLMKLQGFMGYCVEKERKERETIAQQQHQQTGEKSRGIWMPAAAHQKRTRAKSSDDPRRERQRQRQFLARLTSDNTAAPPSPQASASSSSSLLSTNGRARTLPATVSMLLEQHSARVGGVHPDATRQRALVAEALQRLERLLCMLYVSDTLSTRVLWTPTSPTTAAAATSMPAPAVPNSAEISEGVLKVIQLEPGAHTFAPLMTEAKAVVLAGGTMQPLAFTCGPLLPLTEAASTNERGGEGALSHRQSAPHATSRGTNGVQSAAASPLPVRLISEGHVVPPSSVRVFALGTGPSNVRLEFTQQKMGGAPVQPSSTAAATDGTAARMLAEVGCTLLNFARVLPAAGVICFFTSYDMMDRVTEVLEQTGYYAQINEVKRIFRETRSGGPKHDRSPNPTNVTVHATSTQRDAAAAAGEEKGGVTEMLQQYQDWIYGRSAARPSATATHPPLSGNTFSSASQPRRGAMLFAVMGGRLSEGINFADDLGRAVIVLGMPYANPTDVELQLNLRHIATTRLGNNNSGGGGGVAASLLSSTAALMLSSSSSSSSTATSSSSVSSSSPFGSSAEWGLYMDGMMRTVNQCIGRCIRHRGDYAAIILLDARYGERADVRRRVSAWLQPSLRVAQTFGECFSGVRNFFAEKQASPS